MHGSYSPWKNSFTMHILFIDCPFKTTACSQRIVTRSRGVAVDPLGGPQRGSERGGGQQWRIRSPKGTTPENFLRFFKDLISRRAWVTVEDRIPQQGPQQRIRCYSGGGGIGFHPEEWTSPKDNNCFALSPWRPHEEDKRMVLEYTHGLFIT